TSTRPQIEIKTDGNDKLDVIVDELIERDMCGQAIIISFDIEQLKAVYNYASSKGVDIELWFLCDEITDEVIATANSVGGNMWLSASYEKNTTASIQKALDAGIGVSLWTVNTIEDAKMLYDMGVRYMETDILCN
ncbi:MAG: glycerophosphodiester phosphodiesterase, partial [Clostridia bacterium]|nr:glycerophosphodiester phosphodiesterase [Clostridia bacterium]